MVTSGEAKPQVGQLQVRQLAQRQRPDQIVVPKVRVEAHHARAQDRLR